MGLRLPAAGLLALVALSAAGTGGAVAAPLSPGAMRDRVLPAAMARAAQTGTTVDVLAPSGVTIPVTIDSRLGAGGAAVAQQYVDFLDGLPHGSELAQLKMTLVPAEDVNALCGGNSGTQILACYGPGEQRMIVPGDATVTVGGITVQYVLTHEYGHHIAANRSNAPVSALDYGPKRWSSHQLVCDKVGQGKLFPGDQNANYLRDPGESWAETYARLTFPEEAWRFTSLLRPDAGALDAARSDVLTPWTAGRTRTVTGTLRRGGRTTRSYQVTLRLDGRFSVQLRGPRRAQYDLRLSSLGTVRDRTRTRGAQDRIVYANACREVREERVTITVVRRSGSPGGPFRLTIGYAG